MELGGWLRSLGLEQYEAAFRDNAIDGSILSSLTAEDLKELGVDAVGHRRKLLDAIAALRANRAIPERTDGIPALDRRRPAEPAERRRITVAFADLVGSTALSTRMDPEDLRELLSAYRQCVVETVRRFDGIVAAYSGDGVLIYFGHPQAHEDDAERAVAAGLRVISAVNALDSRVSLQVRVGIATGLVVVGDWVGSGAMQQHDVVGETPNLAARLQAIAEPNTVVIAEGTRRLLGNLFELRDMGTIELKGIGGKVQAWEALRPSPVASRFEALRARSLTALVGREEETELLLGRWTQANAGAGQVVLLSGDAGIGKSRLVAALSDRVASAPHTFLRCFCSPQHLDDAFYPIVGEIERAAGLATGETAAMKLDKLDALLAQSATTAPDAALIAEMLSLPNDGRYPALSLTAAQSRRRTLAALIARLEVLAAQNSVLMVIEDAHWADPSTLELIGLAVDRIPKLRLLLIVTFRPDFEPPWIGRPQVTTLAVTRLAQPEIGVMIDRVAGDALLPARVRQEIIERTDGVPLFVEEMTKAVLELASPEAREHALAAVPSAALAVPATLYASLMARLDRLGAAKDLVQIGAALGREFSEDLLAAVLRRPRSDLEAALERLVRAGLLFREGVPPHATYLFKHALIQDVAYGTLLREARSALHRRIAEALESQFAELARTQPALLARHWTEAGLIEKALGYWLTAGNRAIERCAMAEAIAQLRKGLGLLARLPDEMARDRHELELQIALGWALRAAQGNGAVVVGETYARVRQLCEKLNQPSKLVHMLLGSYTYHASRGEYLEAHRLAAELASLDLQDAETRLIILAFRVVRSFNGGEFTAVRDDCEQWLEANDPHRPALSPKLRAEDPHCALLIFLSRSLFVLGHLDQARRRQAEAVARAQDLAHARTLAFVHMVALRGCRITGAAAAMLADIDELCALSIEDDFFRRKLANIVQGLCRAVLGWEREGLALMARDLEAAEAAGYRVWEPTLRLWLADAHRALNETVEGLRQVDAALRVAEVTGLKDLEAETYSIRGELLASAGDLQAAEQSFHRAIAVARRQSAKLYELRASMGLARLWHDQGRRAEASDLLARVYGWFTEGFDTPDLRDARALLGRLSSEQQPSPASARR